MAAFRSKGFNSKCKKRINQKLLDIIDEADNTSSILDEEVSKLKETVAAFQLNEDPNCYDVYQEIKNMLENFSEKLFLINNMLRPDTVDSCIPITCDEKQISHQIDATSESTCGSEFKDDDPQKQTPPTSACKPNSVSAPVWEMPMEPTSSAACGETFQFRKENECDSVKSEISSISKDNINSHLRDDINQSQSDNTILDTENALKVSQESIYHSMSSGSKTSLSDSEKINNHLPRSDQQTHLSSYVTSTSDQLDVSQLSTTNLACLPGAANDLSVKEIPSPVVQVESYVFANLTEFQNPSEFWLQLWEPDDTSEYLFKLESYTRLDSSAVKSHGYCLAPLERLKDAVDVGELYQRARIINFFGSGENLTVVVFFIDYGYTALVDSCKLQVMPESFFSQPARAISCYLYGVVPTGYRWSNEAHEKFLKVASYRDRVFIVAENNGKFAVDFIIPLPEEEETCNLSDYLCCLELAMPASNSDVQLASTDNERTLIAEGSTDYKSDEDLDPSCINDAKNDEFKTDCREKLSSASVNNTASDGVESEYCDSSHSSHNESIVIPENIPAVVSSPSPKIVDDRNEDRNLKPDEICIGEKNDMELSEFDWNFKIPPPELSYVEKNKILVVPSAIFSPSEFYVNPACKHALDFDNVQVKMNKVYNQMTRLEDYNVEEEQPQPGMFCCSPMSEKGCWYRAQILSIYNNEANINQKMAFIQLVDYGDRYSIPVAELRPLVKEFSEFPAFSILCSLALVSPKGSDEWTTDAIEKFKEILGFEKFYDAEFFGNKELPDNRVALDVFLHDATGNGDILINHILIEQGLADEVEFVSQKPEESKEDLEDALSQWNPMAEDYSSIRNSYKVLDDDISMVIDDYQRNDDRVICKFFADQGRCHRRVCNFLHIRTGEDPATREREALTLPLENGIPLPNPRSTVMGQISYIIDPAHFYLILPFGSSSVNELHCSTQNKGQCFAEYESLETAMNSFYTGSALNEVTTLALPLGMIIAAKHAEADLWLRARVMDVLDVDKPVQVFFVDKGMTEWVKREWIREMPLEYLHCPFQAVECFLTDTKPKDYENNVKWSNQSRTFFKNLMEGKMLMVYVDQKIGSILNVRLKMTASDGAIFVDDLLVHAGYAQYVSPRNDCQAKLKHSKNGVVENLSSVTQPG